MTAPSVSSSEQLSNLLFRRTAFLTRIGAEIDNFSAGVSGSRGRLSEAVTAGSCGDFTLSDRRGEINPEVEPFATLIDRQEEGFDLAELSAFCSVSAVLA
jgi:hypothetical protein